MFSSKFTQLLPELPCLHVCPKWPFSVRLLHTPKLALQFAFSSTGSCFQSGLFGLESAGKIIPIDAIFCQLLLELRSRLFQFFDALLTSANSELGVLKFRAQLLRTRLLGCHDRLAANEFDDELAVVDQIGGVEVGELSHALGQARMRDSKD
jgi:hypothetical protein